MNHPPNFLEWSQEEKDRYASQKMSDMRKVNKEIRDRYEKAERDKRAAEYRNSSVTNSANAQKPDASSERSRSKRVDRDVSRYSASSERYRSKRVDRDVPTYPREWDRGKESVDWEAGPKEFKNNRKNDYERKNLRNEARTSSRDDRNYRNEARTSSRDDRNYRNEARTSSRDDRNYRNEARTSSRDDRNYRNEARTSSRDDRNYRNEARTSSRDDRNYRNDHVPDKKNKHYNKNQHNRAQFYEGSSKQSWYQNSESSRKFHQQQDKNKRYFSCDTERHDKHQSNSSSTNSESRNNKWNKPRSSNTEASALWHSERLNEDKNKRERCAQWVKSVSGSKIEKERIYTDENEEKISPKRKLDKFETISDKCLNDNDVLSVGSSSNNKPKQSYSLKSRKIEYADNKSSTKVTQKTQILRKSFTKFDRINRSVHSSEDSDSDENLESNKQDFIEKDNNNLEKIHINCNIKRENLPSEENEEPPNFESKFFGSKSESRSPLYNSGSHFVKGFSDNQRYSPVRKVYSHNDGYVISREFTYSDRGCNEKDLKKSSKFKQNPYTTPQYNLPESCKNEHFSKHRKFDKGQSNETMNNQRGKWNRQYFVSSGNKTRSMKAEKYTSDKKKSDYNVVQSSNQDEDGWGNIDQSQVADDGWGNVVEENDDGWGNVVEENDDGWGNVVEENDDGWGNVVEENDDGWDNIVEDDDDDGCNIVEEDDDDGCNIVEEDDDDDGCNIVEEDDDDDGGNIVEEDDDDDGIWDLAMQSDIKWKINEDINTKKKSAKKDSGDHNKEAKAVKVKHAIGSDDGGWSTVEEGEMKSDDDDDFGESKEHVK